LKQNKTKSGTCGVIRTTKSCLGKKPPVNCPCGVNDCPGDYEENGRHYRQALIEAADWIEGLNNFNCICQFNKYGINIACNKCLFDDAVRSMRISAGVSSGDKPPRNKKG